MKCVFLCSVPISHIIPIQPIVESLVKKNINVTVISSKSNKDRIQSFGASFIEYPFDFTGKNDFTSLINRGIKFNKLISEKEYEKAYDYFIEEDTKYFYDHSFDRLNLLYNIIKREHPDFIIRDAVDRYGTSVAKLLNIPCIGWITHSLYSKKYFDSNPTYLYKVFLNAIEIDDEKFDKYLLNFREKCESIHNNVYMHSNTFKINTLHQFDPCEEVTLINSIESLQPVEAFDTKRKYLFVYPKLERFRIEKNIDKKLIEFIKQSKLSKKKIVYISTGSMLSLNYHTCIKLINNLIKNDTHIIMSNNVEYIKLTQYYCNHSNEVYIDKFIPQQFVLSNTDLFITSAGQNSILESIYHKVPLLAIPFTSEQKLNGLLIEEKGIGKTTYIQRNSYITFGTLVKQLLTDEKYYFNLEKLNFDLINDKSQLNELIKYVYERKKKIKNFYIS